MLASLAIFIAAKPVLDIILKPTKATFTIGEEIKFTAPTINLSRFPVMVVLQGDGMQEGRKAPYCQIQFRQHGSDIWQAPHAEGGCGNTNPIRPEDFIELKPNASIDILGGMEWSILDVKNFSATPGIYQFRIVYDTSRPIENWIGGPIIDKALEETKKAIWPFWNRVPKGIFESKPVAIRLVEAKSNGS